MHAVKRAIDFPYRHLCNIPRYLKKSVASTAALFSLANIRELARHAFLLIGKMFLYAGLAAATPAFAVESLFKRVARRPTKYTIGSEKRQLTKAEWTQALKKLERLQRNITRLEIKHPEAGSFMIGKNAIASLRVLTPDKIIVKNSLLPQSLLDELETLTHFYQKNEYDPSYSLKKKITHLVVPKDEPDALQLLDDLADRNERVVNVYLHKNASEETHQALVSLRPQNILLIEHQNEPFLELLTLD